MSEPAIAVPASPLTDRENEVLQLVAKGLSNQEIATALGCAKATVRTHVEHVFEKMDVTNRTEAAVEGIRRGLVQL